MTKALAITLVGASMLAGCALTDMSPPQAPVSAASIDVSVGPCFGFCPVYSVKVADSGSLLFNGERHTAVLGQRSGLIDRARFAQVAATLEPFRPSSAQAATECAEGVASDQPTVTISWVAPSGKTQILTHDRGCRSHPLNKVLDDLPQQLGISEWMQQVTRPGVSRG